MNANNYKNGAGAMVKSTFYETQNHALQLAARRGSHLVTVDLGYQRIPQQGFANARMDMTRNEAKFVNVRYGGALHLGRTRRARLLRRHAARDEHSQGQDPRHEHAHGDQGRQPGLRSPGGDSACRGATLCASATNSAASRSTTGGRR